MIVTADILSPPVSTISGATVSIAPSSNFEASMASTVTVPATLAHASYDASTGLAHTQTTIQPKYMGVYSQGIAPGTAPA